MLLATQSKIGHSHRKMHHFCSLHTKFCEEAHKFLKTCILGKGHAFLLRILCHVMSLGDMKLLVPINQVEE